LQTGYWATPTKIKASLKMTQAYKTLTGKGLVEFTVMKYKLDEPGYFRVEYRLFTFADEAVLLREFTNAITTNLGCIVERNDQDGSHGSLYLIPDPKQATSSSSSTSSSEMLRH
jgi:hypothetical protein